MLKNGHRPWHCSHGEVQRVPLLRVCGLGITLVDRVGQEGRYGTLGLGHRKRGGFCFVPWNSREPGAVCEKSDHPEA